MGWRDIELSIPSPADLTWSPPHKWRLSLRIVSICVTGLLAFACAWMLGDSYEEFEQATRQVQRLKASDQAAVLAASRLQELQAKEQAVLGRMESGSQAFLLSDELPDLLDLIASMCLRRRVALESLEVGDVLSQYHIDKQPLSLSLRGTYQDIGSLQLEFTKLPWPIIVDGLRVSAAQEDARVLEMRVRLLVPTRI